MSSSVPLASLVIFIVLVVGACTRPPPSTPTPTTMPRPATYPPRPTVTPSPTATVVPTPTPEPLMRRSVEYYPTPLPGVLAHEPTEIGYVYLYAHYHPGCAWVLNRARHYADHEAGLWIIRDDLDHAFGGFMGELFNPTLVVTELTILFCEKGQGLEAYAEVVRKIDELNEIRGSPPERTWKMWEILYD